MAPYESLADAVLTAASPLLRAAALCEGADAINALPQDHECDPGRGDAAKLLRSMATDSAPVTEQSAPLSRQRDRITNDTVKTLAKQPTDTEAYSGELAMLRGVIGVVRTVAEHGDMDELRRIVAEHRADEQAACDEAPADEQTADWVDDVRQTLAFNENVQHPAAVTVRDVLLDTVRRTPGQALTAAGILLAAHTRELAAAAHKHATQRGEEMREAGDRSRRATCTGMHDIARMLDQRAALLDPQS
ncbi:hypothetical protein [Streptomyces sp. NBC_00439]|uniref:hypothetical protein n=1 Tax=Streptomyces sp. NBC_00439 TaxID=2903650 RepID=UPI00224FE4DE|nr:hypothetical protein [Streptomyces sp. NBC_00439]MCX5103442.1 hypothetical protein [Streptomyces sp. NBC_00439]